jgi:hypothetical protein
MKYIFIIALIALFFAAAFGWGMNIYTIAHMESVISGIGIVRIIGIFLAPLGALLGYF